MLQGGVLYQKLAGEDGENVQFVLPDSMKDCGHLGQDKTVELICQQFCWPGMGKEAHSKLREVHKLQILSLTSVSTRSLVMLSLFRSHNAQ